MSNVNVHNSGKERLKSRKPLEHPLIGLLIDASLAREGSSPTRVILHHARNAATLLVRLAQKRYLGPIDATRDETAASAWDKLAVPKIRRDTLSGYVVGNFDELASDVLIALAGDSSAKNPKISRVVTELNCMRRAIASATEQVTTPQALAHSRSVRSQDYILWQEWRKGTGTKSVYASYFAEIIKGTARALEIEPIPFHETRAWSICKNLKPASYTDAFELRPRLVNTVTARLTILTHETLLEWIEAESRAIKKMALSAARDSRSARFTGKIQAAREFVDWLNLRGITPLDRGWIYNPLTNDPYAYARVPLFAFFVELAQKRRYFSRDQMSKLKTCLRILTREVPPRVGIALDGGNELDALDKLARLKPTKRNEPSLTALVFDDIWKIRASLIHDRPEIVDDRIERNILFYLKKIKSVEGDLLAAWRLRRENVIKIAEAGRQAQ